MDPHRFNDLCKELEKKEIDAPNGTPPTSVYLQLLAIYLYQHELTQAKFLWKRISPETKLSNSELSAVWDVGKNMWMRDFEATYVSLNKEWSATTKDIMSALLENIRMRAINLVSKAYTSISLDDLSKLLGQSTEETLNTIVDLKWTLESQSNMVFPVSPSIKRGDPVPSAEQLQRLTKYVSFLEC